MSDEQPTDSRAAQPTHQQPVSEQPDHHPHQQSTGQQAENPTSSQPPREQSQQTHPHPRKQTVTQPQTVAEALQHVLAPAGILLTPRAALACGLAGAVYLLGALVGIPGLGVALLAYALLELAAARFTAAQSQ